MSPAPETVRRPPSSNSGGSASPSLSISTILSRAPRTPNESPGPFSADRRVSTGIRRNFSGGPRPAPFAQRTVPATATTSAAAQGNEDTNSTRAMLISALETRRRRIEELRNQTNIATTIADQWRRQRMDVVSYRGARSTSPDIDRPVAATSVAPRLLLDDTSDSDSEDDNDDNKWGINEPRRTPPPTFLTPNTSTSTHMDTTSQDDDSSRNAYVLSCRYCANVLTPRGMRARLVADSRVHIWSTDEQPR